jgi:hypothetical protein
MDSSPWLGFIEMGVVLLFALGWGIMELVGIRLDRKRGEERERRTTSEDPPH